MITQQMYTRERRGVYRSTEGFDTVAKSEALEHNFVKKILHPFCVYAAPSELTARGEKEESQYPAALHLFHADNGETVIGTSRYQAADFTGQRSAFFAHNYVVPAARAEEIVQSYGDYLFADFAHSYEGEPGGTLPELAAIPAAAGKRPEPLKVLQALGFSEGLFKSLLQAVMTAVAGKKKIYIALDVPVRELPIRAAELTEILYSVLPYEYRRRLGVITYAQEPQSRKYIHLTFVEKGSLRPGDRSIEKDFTFDLVSGRIGNADFGDTNVPYADLAWKLLTRSAAGREDFARFADQMLRSEHPERRLSLALYNELALFYEIEQGEERLYEENKSLVLSGLLSYLKPEGAIESRMRLNDMFLERFDREFDLIRHKGIPEPVILESFKDYFVLRGHSYKVKVVDYFINGLLNSAVAGREDVLSSAYDIIESEDELSAAFFKRVLAQPVFRKQLMEPYMESRLASAARSADILRFVLHWGRFLPEALQQAFVRDAVRDYLGEKLLQEQEPVSAVAAIHDTIEQAEKEQRRGAGVHPEALSLLEELATAADRFLLNRLSMSMLTQEQLLEIAFLRYRGAADWHPPLDLMSKQKANALRAAYRWFGEENPDATIFAKLSPKELDEVQLLGRRWLQEARGAEPFERLPLAFYYSNDREGGPLDYEKLLELVRVKAGENKETVYRFLAWSQGNPLFTVSNKKLHTGYRRAILRYFQNHDREAFKNRDFRKTYADTARPALQNVYNEARSQLASPLARWISRSRFQLLITGSLLGLVLIAAIVMISLLRPDGQETALPEATPSPSPVTTAGAPGDISPVAAYVLDSGGAGEGGNELIFTFTDPAACDLFNPQQVHLMNAAGDEVAQSYDVEATMRSCTAATPQAGGNEPAAGADDESPTADPAGGVEESASPTEGAGDNSDPAATEAAGGTADNAGQTAETADSSTAEPSATPAAGSGAEVQPETALRVEVTLAQEVVIPAGSMIKAGGMTLSVKSYPQPLPSPSGDPAGDEELEAEATPSPKPTVE
ncbi:hypothetical protein B9T62_37795 [Paenibacillus donghaensis]|uniref:Glycosyltransferase n=2 Tax=Paenibacillus donghaensis TaxID=414771 RepID=A0A2Z2KGR7_9BACL|nr:hypothetical protein B9T62_37795 [Paenibacillus donghaensis]